MNKKRQRRSNISKNNEWNVRDKRFVVLYVFVAILLLVGITYAITSSSLSLDLTTGKVAIDFGAYGSTTFDNSELDFKPILDSEVDTNTDNVIKIEFKVGGASSNNVDNIIYDIALNDLEVDCSLLSPYIKWKLVKNGTELSTGSLDYKFDTITNGRLVLTNIQQDLPTYSASQAGYDNYVFYLWFSDSCQNADLATCKANNSIVDQSELVGKLLEGKVEVELYAESKKALTRNPDTEIDYSLCSNFVTFDYNGGTIAEEKRNFVIGQPYGDLPTPTKSYTLNYVTNTEANVDSQDFEEIFSGWYLDPNFTTRVTNDTIVNQANSQTLYAKWFGGENNVITLPELAPRTGYIFRGWYTDEKFTFKAGNPGESYQVTKDTTLYAKWTLTQVRIHYNVNGGILAGSSNAGLTVGDNGWIYSSGTIYTQDIDYGTTATPLAWDNPNLINVSKTGHVAKTSAEWCTNADGTGTCYNDSTNYASTSYCDASSADCDLNLYINWNKLITITYDANGGTGTQMDDTVYEFGQSESVIVSTNTYTKVGYNFAYWHMYDPTTDKWYGCTDNSGDCTSVEENTTLGWYSLSAIVNYYQPTGNNWSLSTTAHPNSMIFYAQWERNVTCASVGSTMAYAGLNWTVIANDTSTCKLALNGLSSSTGSYTDATSKLTNEYLKSGGASYNSTMAAEYNAGLLKSITSDSNSTTGLTSTSKTWWLASGSVRVQSYTKYSGTNQTIYRGSKWNTTTSWGDWKTNSAYYSAPSTSTISAATKTATASATTYSLTNGTKTTTTDTDYGSYFVWNEVFDRAGTANVVTMSHTLDNTWEHTTVLTALTAYAIYFRPCGGSVHGKTMARFTANSTTQFNLRVYSYDSNGTQSYTDYVRPYITDLSSTAHTLYLAGNGIAPEDTTNPNATKCASYGCAVYNVHNSTTCKKNTIYKISNKSVSIYYRPTIVLTK